ncbi:hypothetical protein GWI33_001583 [Rhynchophorus ferrugineus]|uniref:cGMP-dependent protein kinase n=1 Tax=Rhynchophorus ferrugineus TaxID=354439 RepID=A0A834IQD4_RHYFE|nr:hypothetical protein GWI33_001583 [Rhynchophorus ferrugineus]
MFGLIRCAARKFSGKIKKTRKRAVHSWMTVGKQWLNLVCKALSDSKVWMLDRKVFQQIMKRTGLQRLQDNINSLKSVPLLESLSNDVLTKVADVLEVEFYPAGAYIIRQGASGDTFFIISSGSVKVTQRLPGHLDEEEIRTLGRGDYFGEQALLKEDCRTASVIALNPGVECLTLDRDSFNQLLGSLSEIKEKDYGDEQRMNRPVIPEQQEYDYISLDDLEVVGTLGVGGFGRVELVQYTRDPSLTFALKCLKKQHIVETQQQDHIYSERNIMLSCRSQFICRLFRTYRDSKYVYMLLEACLGGEVWTILRDRGCFDDHTCRFVTACVIEAFDYLHARGIIYRDLKPENLLVDNQGYVKLVDFGFSKRLGYSSKTWTFCGTPVYVAPETILNKGHDRAVDYWALGILMHELLTGNPPFTASDPMKTYNLILKGIDMVDFGNVGRSAQSLIKKLCRDLPSERLGYQRGGDGVTQARPETHRRNVRPEEVTQVSSSGGASATFQSVDETAISAGDGSGYDGDDESGTSSCSLQQYPLPFQDREIHIDRERCGLPWTTQSSEHFLIYTLPQYEYNYVENLRTSKSGSER